MELIQQLHWRYATKRMTGQNVPAEKLTTILEATRLAPSSMGLQPYTILVIENPELKKQLRAAANNQPQIEECSQLLVFCAWDGVKPEQVEAYIDDIATTRKVDVSSLDGFKNNLLNFISIRNQEHQFQWAAKQIYIALGFAMAAAALEQVDATPMEGFKAAEFDEILGLNEKGLKSVVLCAIGYRDTANDFLNGKEKVRRAKEQLFEFI